MLERSARRASVLVASLALVLSACNGGSDSTDAAGSKPTPTKTPRDEAKEPTKPETKTPTPEAKAETKVEPKPTEPTPAADGGKAEGGEPAAAEGGEPDAAAEGGEAGAEGGDAAEGGKDEGGAAEAGDGGEAAEGGDAPETGSKDSASLIKEARTTKTTDERALEALAEAETAGATVKELARAAKARGDYLYKTPERAKVFYEWSAAKDETYPEPVFALAKQSAITGDVEEVVKRLKEVSERKGGKKLLQQIDFDPTWDIVKDDPDVRALL